ncbi:hypothetical protein [Enterobacter roggenkampii]|uniref:hypothetical protein n=1 Tax=Enterobacter roggenkampii TaxID=1812935 RepID=UPI00350FB112
MNRTDGEPETETDVMATAFSTMRKYGSNIPGEDYAQKALARLTEHYLSNGDIIQ